MSSGKIKKATESEQKEIERADPAEIKKANSVGHMKPDAEDIVAEGDSSNTKSVKTKKNEEADTKKKDPKEKYTLFYGIKSPFSQFHPAKFTIDDISYSCAEQYMMHQKAVTFKDTKMASEILKTSCPKTMKKLGRKVQNFDKTVWSAKCKGVVKRASVAKYSQNAKLKADLLKTAGTVLAEGSPRDRLWGIGLGASNPKAKNKVNWRGKNWLGYILTEVRDDMMKQE